MAIQSAGGHPDMISEKIALDTVPIRYDKIRKVFRSSEETIDRVVLILNGSGDEEASASLILHIPIISRSEPVGGISCEMLW